jgi:hypothetical protein
MLLIRCTYHIGNNTRCLFLPSCYPHHFEQSLLSTVYIETNALQDFCLGLLLPEINPVRSILNDAQYT